MVAIDAERLLDALGGIGRDRSGAHRPALGDAALAAAFGRDQEGGVDFEPGHAQPGRPVSAARWRSG